MPTSGGSARWPKELDDLIEDDDFWRYRAHGLAVYATPDNLRTFRVPTDAASAVGKASIATTTALPMKSPAAS